MKRKPIPQHWLDSGRMALGPGYWEMTGEEPRAFVLDRIPVGRSDGDGVSRTVGVPDGSREGAR